MPSSEDLNARRKLEAGRADTGRCGCGRYRLFCRNGCLDGVVKPLNPWTPAVIQRFDEEREIRHSGHLRLVR